MIGVSLSVTNVFIVGVLVSFIIVFSTRSKEVANLAAVIGWT